MAEPSYEIDGDRVVLTDDEATADPFATFSEWAGDLDTEAYATL